ncbi:MAG: ankyrin repeat domain-containing protein [Beijerinckiaceae bacterium]
MGQASGKAFLPAAALFFYALLPGQAQIAPSAAEVRAYAGLHAAAAGGDASAIVRLADGDKKALEARDGNGRTPLHVAAFLKQRTAIATLIKAGANTAALDNQKYDAVTIAAVADDAETLRTLLENGASAKLTTSIYDGTALIAAAHLGHDECVRLLIKHGAPLDHVNNLRWTASIEAVVLGNGGTRHQQTLRYLIEAGANTKLADAAGKTPLDHARARGYVAMVRMLEAARR